MMKEVDERAMKGKKSGDARSRAARLPKGQGITGDCAVQY